MRVVWSLALFFFVTDHSVGAESTPPRGITITTATLTLDFRLEADGNLYQHTLGAPPALKTTGSDAA